MINLNGNNYDINKLNCEDQHELLMGVIAPLIAIAGALKNPADIAGALAKVSKDDRRRYLIDLLTPARRIDASGLRCPVVSGGHLAYQDMDLLEEAYPLAWEVVKINFPGILTRLSAMASKFQTASPG